MQTLEWKISKLKDISDEEHTCTEDFRVPCRACDAGHALTEIHEVVDYAIEQLGIDDN